MRLLQPPFLNRDRLRPLFTSRSNGRASSQRSSAAGYSSGSVCLASTTV